ncbi:ParB/Srx family N-terminal domain-containing protein [Crenobacter sp. SG2305]|uniref:ParB/Srx family N-terminal domain-containing protein n=1 Tax=Crenobacter oryzisoli TaxID=3056844 RepID=UPI0025AA67F7|nr:ParB/Srx family N-terminal domain-containing protein [Crenobacter sp. SG2305]MDN0081169.1 ParB/Srx family N-terminal domain-containing protein [Crenobacter sp. SG2305]
MRRLVLALLLGLLGNLASAETLPACTPQSAVGSRCEVPLVQLHPTQPGVGLMQVADERARLAKRAGKDSPEAFQTYLIKKRIPIVIGPDGGFYLVDRHHLSRALWDNGVRQAPAEIEGRLADAAGFWPTMQARHWAWLKDEHGKALDPGTLPATVAALPDYPYRSLAGYAERAGLFRKDGQVYFIEFAWAQYLGEQLGWRPIERATLPATLEAARAAACAPAAADLPGYPGAVCPTH